MHCDLRQQPQAIRLRNDLPQATCWQIHKPQRPHFATTWARINTCHELTTSTHVRPAICADSKVRCSLCGATAIHHFLGSRQTQSLSNCQTGNSDSETSHSPRSRTRDATPNNKANGRTTCGAALAPQVLCRRLTRPVQLLVRRRQFPVSPTISARSRLVNAQ